jgi:hypothetical protein
MRTRGLFAILLVAAAMGPIAGHAAAPEPKFECPKTHYVNCMPPIKPAQRPLCSKEYKAWVQTHCPGVEFVY